MAHTATKRVLYKAGRLSGAAWKKTATSASAAAVRTRRWAANRTRQVFLPADLEKLQAGEHPTKRDLVLRRREVDIWEGPELDKIARIIGRTPPSGKRREWVQNMAAFVATSTWPQFARTREHFTHVDVDSAGNIWFSNRNRGEPINAKGMDNNQIAGMLLGARIRKETKTGWTARFLTRVLIAWGVTAASAPGLAWMATQGLQAGNNRTLTQLHRQITRLEQAQNVLRNQTFGEHVSREEIARAQQEISKLETQINSLKYDRPPTGNRNPENQQSVNARNAAVQKQINAVYDLIQRSYRLGRRPPSFPALPLVIAGLSMVRGRREEPK